MKIKLLLPWLMWILATVFFCYEFSLQVSLGVMANDLMRDFSVNATSLGSLAAVYFYAYVAMQIPGGVLIDYFGARRLLSSSVFICACGAILFATTHIFFVAILGRLLIGLGSSTAYIGCAYIAATRLPIHRFTLLNGLVVTMGMLGAVGGQAPLAFLVAKLHWRLTMVLLAAIGLVIALLMWLIIGDKVHTNQNNSSIEQPEQSLLVGLKYVLRSKQTWLCSFFGCLMYTPTLIFGTLWGVPFLTEKYKVSTPFAATLVSMLFFGWAVGSPLFGNLSDRIKKRKIFMILSSIGGCFALSAVIYLPEIPHILIGVLIFGIGFLSSGFITSYTVAREINPPSAVGATMGFVNGVNMLGGAFLPPVVGFILDASKFNYELGLTLLPIALVIALVLSLLIKETNAKSKFEHD